MFAIFHEKDVSGRDRHHRAHQLKFRKQIHSQHSIIQSKLKKISMHVV